MRFLGARLQDFRNIGFAGLELDDERVFFSGANAQGKSNLLEALALVTALRSFRTRDLRALHRAGASGFALLFRLEHERLGDVTVELRHAAAGWQVLVDDERVGRLADFIGRFPVVPLSSADLMILRGGPGERRRFFDLTLSATDPDYYAALRGYHRGLAGRNRLLKANGSDAEMDAFEAEIAPLAAELAAKRLACARAVDARVREAVGLLAGDDEGLSLVYRPHTDTDGAEACARMLREARRRDRILGATQKGPHRDDFEFTHPTGGAREFGSDGQQRGFVVALRLAQARFFSEQLGVAPVLLVDDVLGELDESRRAGFWRACPPELQILATGTRRPVPGGGPDWSLWEVEAGQFRREGS